MACILNASTSSGLVTSADTSGELQFQSNGVQIGTLCRAWVNFNGTGTVAIRASFNVSSITDNGTGNYTVNFTTAMPDTNYSIVGTVEDSNFSTLVTSVGGTLTTNAVQVLTGLELTKYEYERVYVVVFR